jgi:hypothetical protein
VVDSTATARVPCTHPHGSQTAAARQQGVSFSGALDGQKSEDVRVGPTLPDDLDAVTNWYFAVGGLQTQQARIAVNRAIALSRLESYPRAEQLVLSLRDLTAAGCMAHYGEELVQHELLFDASYFEDYEQVFQTAGLLMGALRIRTGADVFCPAVCERSWASLGGVTGNTCRANRVEQVMRTHKFGKAYLVTPDDLEWVGRTLGPMTLLMQDDRFATAVEALCSYLHAGNYRMMAAQLWAGVEALFDVQHEVSYRIAVLAALLLEKRGPRCRDLFKQLRKLYNERSRAVHGSKLEEGKLARHVDEVRTLLARLLSRLIERGQMPTAGDLDDLIVMPESERNP